MREGIGQTARVRLGRFGALVGMMLTLIVCGTIAADTKSPSKREQLLAQRSKAWDLYYAGKYDEALKAAEQLEKSTAADKDQRAAQLEAIHILARCYWADGSKASRAEAQRRWKDLEKADDYLANAARGRIAKALMVEDPKKPAQTAQAIALLEEVVKKAIPYTSTAEAAVELARLYVKEKRFDDARKVMELGEEFLKRQVKVEMPQVEAGPFLKALKDLKAHLKYDATPGLSEFEAAEKLRKAEKFPEAIAAYRAVLKTYPETDYAPRSDLAIGQCLLGQKKLAEATNHFKKFITPLPAGPWRGQAYVELIDLFLEEVLDLNEAGKYADLARASLPAALADAKAGDSWKAIAYDVQLRVGLVSFCQNKGSVAAEAFEEAKKLAPNKQAAQSLESLIAAAKAAKAVVPDDVKGDGKGKDNDKVALALSISVIYTVAGRYDDAQAFLHRVCGLPATPGTPPTPARPPMSGSSPAQLAFGIFMKGAVLQAKGNREPAKEQFLASLKAFDVGTWHDETLYRLASIIQNQAEAQHAKHEIADPKPESAARKPLTDKEREAAAKTEKERQVALVKAKEAALPYWRELLRRYSSEDKDGKLLPKSRRCEDAMNSISVLAYGVASVTPEDKSEEAWKDAESALRRFTETYPSGGRTGWAYVARFDITLERMWDMDLARKIADAGAGWAKNRPAQDGSALPIWAMPTSQADIPQTIRYELYVRAGILAYLDKAYDKAFVMFQTASPLKPNDAKGAADDLGRIGAGYLVKFAAARRSILDKDAVAEASTDIQRIAIELAELYFQGLRPEKSESILRQIVDGNRRLGSIKPGLKAYAILEMAAALDRQDGKENEAAATLKLLERPEFKGTYWAGYGLFRRAIYAWNDTQDAATALPLLQAMLDNYAEHPKAEDALFYYVLIASHAKKTDLLGRAGDRFLKQYPHSDKRAKVEELVKNLGVKGEPK